MGRLRVGRRADRIEGEATGAGQAVPRTLVVTDDLDLLDDLLRLAAAAGVELEVAASVGAARRSWLHAPLVVVGRDLAEQLAAVAPPRRPDVVLCDAADDREVWRRAVQLGAERVAELPADEPWLVARLADAVAGPSRDACVCAVVGGRGGAGASTLAAVLAGAGARAGLATLLVDADPLGGGLDLVLGAEDVPGLRWPDLAATAGRIAPGALEQALPRVHGVSLLSWDRGDVLEVPTEAVRAVVDAGRRGFDLVVVDLARRPDPAAAEVLARATVTYLVVPREVRAAASARRVSAAIAAFTGDVRLVTRGPAPAGLTAADVAASVGLPLAADVRAEPGLAASVDRGDPPGRSGPLAAACRGLLDGLLAARVTA